MRARSLLVLVVLGVLVTAGCGAAPPADETLEPVTVAPRQEQPHAEPTPLPDHVEPSTITQAPAPHECDVQFFTHARELADGRVVLLVTARNHSGHAVSGMLVSHCPGPSVHFRGLPDHYIVGGTCTMGACAVDTTRQPFALEDGETRNVAQVEIATHGDTCNAALPDGEYTLGGSVELQGIGSCVAQAAVVRVGAARETLQQPPTRTPPPERCPPVACAYSPCPPGVSPPAGCAGACGCPGGSRMQDLRAE